MPRRTLETSLERACGLDDLSCGVAALVDAILRQRRQTAGGGHVPARTAQVFAGADKNSNVERWSAGGLGALGGVISAEHGIGLEKRAYLQHSRSPEEIGLMITMKQALDPNNLLNPGKVLQI